MQEFKMLFSPIKIGSMESKNRCLMPPMGINYANPDGTLTEREIEFYTARYSRQERHQIDSDFHDVALLYRFLPMIMITKRYGQCNAQSLVRR